MLSSEIEKINKRLAERNEKFLSHIKENAPYLLKENADNEKNEDSLALAMAKEYKNAVELESKYEALGRFSIVAYYVDCKFKIDTAAKENGIHEEFIDCLRILEVYR